MNTCFSRTVAVSLSAALAASCATGPGGGFGDFGGLAGPARPARGQAQDPCNVGAAAALGATAGGVLGALQNNRNRTSKNVARGVLVGGAVAALGCIAVNSYTRQTKSAAQVEKEYVQARGRLPAEPQVLSYQPRLANSVVQRGQPIHVKSVVELVPGANRPITQVREELVVFNQDGEPFKTGSKPLVINSGGRFENTFELTLPKAASQGRYALQTNLYVNGRQAASRRLDTQLVWDGSQARLLASR